MKRKDQKMCEDIFQGADEAECERRRRFEAIYILKSARRRVRHARRRMAGTELTDNEVRLLSLLSNESAAILQRIAFNR